MGHGLSSFEARKRSHLRMATGVFIPNRLG
jgi:hypothetical protein